MRIPWNESWKYSKNYLADTEEFDFSREVTEEVALPHTNACLPYHYFDEASYSFISGYQKIFTAQTEWEDKRVFLTFEGVAHKASVFVNGILIKEHFCGYTAFTVDLRDYLKLGEENVLVVKVDSRETLNMPPFGNVIDYMTYGGIYRKAFLEIKNAAWIQDVFAITEQVLEAPKVVSKVLIGGELQSGDKKLFRIQQNLVQHQGAPAPWCNENTETGQVKIISSQKHFAEKKETAITMKAQDIKLWTLEEPVLYDLITMLYDGERLVDQVVTTIGFRSARFEKDGFYLNGNKIKIRGLNRHQSYPYVGYAMPDRTQREDVRILKQELQLNAVRTSHYPQSQAFIDACDAMGLLVFTELPGWQHIGDEEWKEIACEMVEEMVIQYRNHPSVILWGVRINESQDDDAFYQRTNDIAHQLDSSRQTGGVRFLKKSNLLEDVYTYNDFVHTGKNQGVDSKASVTPDVSKGYLVSEYNGHMFPTKAFDSEAHRLEHALRHARVVDAYYREDGIAGGFGWCMFDYNTHKDFGSGDRICYHGVMDMFRNPKMAAFVYASQSDDKVVMEVSSTMDIGEYPGGNIGEVYCFTNGDSVRLYRNNQFVREFFPDRKQFPHMPHPPVRVDDFIGCLLEKGEGYDIKTADALKEILTGVAKYGMNSLPLSLKLKMAKLMVTKGLKLDDGVRLFYEYVGNWGGNVTTYRFEAVKDGEVVKTVEKVPSIKKKLEVKANTQELVSGETYDVASIRFSMRDENGNLMPYYQEPLRLSVKGALEIIGPDIISLKGGMGGTYVKTIGIVGEGVLIIQGEGLEKITLMFQIK